MSQSHLDALYDYVQERCLWQFFSRSWDREENIEGVLNQVVRLWSGEEPLRGTPQERLFYADALPIVSDIKGRFDWASTIPAEEVKFLIEGLKSRLTETVITRSTNRELNHHLY
ncbi:V-nitrogenase VFe protein subunit VnfG [Azomonas agilis]|uniref:nitrogenase n=3 Tax=Bacteria TaxID=2 RepID=A0A562J048_9GAMM|nr:V-containing nitrogenase subunit delta [Azomonas agilis]ABS28947.1 vanadium dinitrogenase delta subunit [nitrogen-fixing bacterium DP7]ABS28958.1 vanadium dinitrogenase delta subunit [nitrogen-fixing bacterium NC2]TWH76155.1 V-nitrogenase VFe protein subunit VnfG [Azomonas agilis]